MRWTEVKPAKKYRDQGFVTCLRSGFEYTSASQDWANKRVLASPINSARLMIRASRRRYLVYFKKRNDAMLFKLADLS